MKSLNTIRKILSTFLLSFVIFSLGLFSQNDTIYFMKDGLVIKKYDINTQIDSMIFYKPSIYHFANGISIDSRDGNEYNWVKIGNQIWMSENLKYLPSVVEPETGSNIEPYYYVYAYEGINVNDAKLSTNYETYGVLYNWTAALTACPVGWHLPSDAEWTQLIDFAGGISSAAPLLKSQTGWFDIGNGTDQYGFTALPGGSRSWNGVFGNMSYYGGWWSSTEDNSETVWHWGMFYYNNNVFRVVYSKMDGFSVRCVKD